MRGFVLFLLLWVAYALCHRCWEIQHSHLSNSGSLPVCARQDLRGRHASCHLCLLHIFHMFSMDGHLAPWPELVKLHRKYGILLFIDDVSVFISPEIHFFPGLLVIKLCCNFPFQGTQKTCLW
ncbi:hypothetical protein DAI22_09g012600 [Oryza sativa Japonica Group]|nr:hypothetical protein DAI22_09g012600 [Oryza sativa Japonica Group]